MEGRLDPVVNVLLGSKHANYKTAINVIINSKFGEALSPLGKPQDPWQILNSTLRAVIEESSYHGVNPALPVLTCSCGLPNRVTVLGCVEYVRTGSQ